MPARGEPAPGSVLSLQSLAQPGWPTQELRRGNSARKSKGKSSGQQLPSQEPERGICSLIPERPAGQTQCPLYHEPYAAPGPQQHPLAQRELGRVRDGGHGSGMDRDGCGMGLDVGSGWT